MEVMIHRDGELHFGHIIKMLRVEENSPIPMNTCLALFHSNALRSSQWRWWNTKKAKKKF